MRPRARASVQLEASSLVTTGTTAGECARVLLPAGAEQVFVATVVRATREMEIHLPVRDGLAEAAHA